MFDDKISSLRGIGKKREFFFNQLGIFTKRDILFFLPNRYLTLAQELSVGFSVLKVTCIKKFRLSSKFFRVVVLFNETEVFLNFFNVVFFNIFFSGREYFISGEIYFKEGHFFIDSPSIINSHSKIIPTYKGVSSYLFTSIVLPLIEELDNSEKIYDGLSLKQIFFNLHTGFETVRSLKALKFLEASFLLHLFSQDALFAPLNISLDDVLKNFPYTLSSQQFSVCSTIRRSLAGIKPMRHFVYGEVGAGKTIVAIVAILMMINAGYNVVLLAPTVTLAYQHYQEVMKVLPQMADEILLLTSLSKRKKELKENISLAKYKIIIGTHALMFLKEIPNLGLVIIDEIHKFGVLQRSQLIQHASRPNVLMMTATPIPRSLSMIISNLMNYDTLPSFKEKKIKTLWVQTEKKYQLIQRFSGKKVYWVLPNIEESEKNCGIEARAAELATLCENVLILHGRMKDSEKLDIVEQFKALKTGILVATTIIEIGINIPDADIIVVENAESFGLSQLHQLRGRVGRMGQESFCILLSDFLSKKISYMKDFANGFDISQKDLELRGGGQLTGFLQHGSDSFYFLNEFDDEIFALANKETKIFKAFDIFSNVDIGY